MDNKTVSGFAHYWSEFSFYAHHSQLAGTYIGTTAHALVVVVHTDERDKYDLDECTPCDRKQHIPTVLWVTDYQKVVFKKKQIYLC